MVETIDYVPAKERLTASQLQLTGKMPKRIRWGFPISESNPIVVSALPQERGIAQIKEYLKGERTFCEILPFLVSESRGSQTHADEFYVGTFNDRMISFHLNEAMQNIFSVGGTTLALPCEDERKLYQWLDFYEVDRERTVNIDNLIHSCRIDRLGLRINTRNWYGLEKQLFLDYLIGREEIRPEFLEGMRGILSAGKYLEFGYANGKLIRIYIWDSRCKPGQRIVSRPSYYSDRNCCYLEGFTNNEEGSDIRVYTRRFFKGDLKLYESRDPLIEALNDWVKGVLPFEKAVTVTLTVGNTNGIFLGNKFIKFGEQIVEGSVSVVVPRKDELYEWIEVKKRNKELDSGESLIASYRITRVGGLKLDGHWPGAAKQRWIDYLDGKQDFSVLGSLSEIVNDVSGITLFTWRERKIRLIFGKNIFSPGERIRITPCLTQDNST